MTRYNGLTIYISRYNGFKGLIKFNRHPYDHVHPCTRTVASDSRSSGLTRGSFWLVLVRIPATGWGGAEAPASHEISRSVSPGLSLKYPGYPITTKFESWRLIINHSLPSATRLVGAPCPFPLLYIRSCTL